MRLQNERLRKAFTLIELLVVIAIICLLVAILFPVFESARDKARAATCMSNMKQIGAAMLQYTADNDSFYPAEDGCYNGGNTPLPVAGVPTSATGCKGTGQGGLAGAGYGDRLNMYKWWWWLYPYTKNVGVFFCPSRSVTDLSSLAVSDWTGSAEIDTGYALNTSITGALNTYENCSGQDNSFPPCSNTGAFRSSFLALNKDAGFPQPGINQTFVPNLTGNVPQPDQTLLFTEMSTSVMTAYLVEPYAGLGGDEMIDFPAADKGYWNKILFDDPYGASGNGKATDVSTNGVDQTAAPHQGGVIVAYCDGHVKWLSAAQFLANCPPYEQYLKFSSSSYPATQFYFGQTNPDMVDTTSHNWTLSLTASGKDWPMWGLYRSQFP